MTKLFNSAFYQFVLALVAMICMVAVRIMGVSNTEVIDNVLSGVIGAGVWGGIRSGTPQASPPTSPGPGNSSQTP